MEPVQSTAFIDGPGGLLTSQPGVGVHIVFPAALVSPAVRVPVCAPFQWHGENALAGVRGWCWALRSCVTHYVRGCARAAVFFG